MVFCFGGFGAFSCAMWVFLVSAITFGRFVRVMGVD